MIKTQTIAIDFDGTICKKQPYGDGVIYEIPTLGAKETLRKLQTSGYKIVIFTTRLNPGLRGDVGKKQEAIEEWLQRHGIVYNEITNNKPSAIAYIDDRAIRFENNWDSICNYFI